MQKKIAPEVKWETRYTFALERKNWAAITLKPLRVDVNHIECSVLLDDI